MKQHFLENIIKEVSGEVDSPANRELIDVAQYLDGVLPKNISLKTKIHIAYALFELDIKKESKTTHYRVPIHENQLKHLRDILDVHLKEDGRIDHTISFKDSKGGKIVFVPTQSEDESEFVIEKK